MLDHKSINWSAIKNQVYKGFLFNYEHHVYKYIRTRLFILLWGFIRDSVIVLTILLLFVTMAISLDEAYSCMEEFKNGNTSMPDNTITMFDAYLEPPTNFLNTPDIEADNL